MCALYTPISFIFSVVVIIAFGPHKNELDVDFYLSVIVLKVQ